MIISISSGMEAADKLIPRYRMIQAAVKANAVKKIAKCIRESVSTFSGFIMRERIIAANAGPVPPMPIVRMKVDGSLIL